MECQSLAYRGIASALSTFLIKRIVCEEAMHSIQSSKMPQRFESLSLAWSAPPDKYTDSHDNSVDRKQAKSVAIYPVHEPCDHNPANKKADNKAIG